MASIYVTLLLSSVLIVIAESRVLKSEFTVPPEGASVEVIIRQISGKSDTKPPIATMKFDLKGDKLIFSRSDENKELKPEKADPVPSIDNRNAFRSSACPIGYNKRGGFCFPADDYDY